MTLDDLKPHDRVQMRYVIRRETARRIGTVERVNRKSVRVVWDDGRGVQTIQCVGVLEPHAPPPEPPGARPGKETKP